jgi:hypothetical protein
MMSNGYFNSSNQLDSTNNKSNSTTPNSTANMNLSKFIFNLISNSNNFN